MNRNSTIDALKAFAIFLVVLGHFLQTTILNFDENYLFKLIYSFHMPLFVFLSGYLSYRKDGLKKDYLKRRFLSLIVPYLTWMILSSIISGVTSGFNFISTVLNIFFYPDNGLYFLWVLFWMHLVLYCCSFVPRKYFLTLLIVIAFLVTLIPFAFSFDNFFGNKIFASLFPYFIIGYLVRQYGNKTNFIFKSWYFLLPLFLFLVYFWHRTDALDFNHYLVSSKLFIFIYKIIVAIIGIIISVGLFRKIKTYYKAILLLGENSIAIYAMNFYCLKVIYPSFDSVIINSFLYYFYAVFLTLMIISICLLIANILKKNKLSSLIFLGDIKNWS